MKINDRFDGNLPADLTEKTDGPSPGTAVPDPAPAELPAVRQPKTDSVELKTASFYNFDQVAKLDPSKVNIGKGNEVPSAMIPGVPFREKVELPKTLPNGTSVDSPVANGDLGLGKKTSGPNHMGIDMKGTTIKNQLDDALKLKEGSQSTTPAAPSGNTVNYNQIGSSHARDDKTYHAGLNRPGMGKFADGDQNGNDIGADKNGNTDKNDLQGFIPEAGFLDRWLKSDTPGNSEAKKQIEERINNLKKKKEAPDGGTKEYVNPDAPEGTQPPVVTAETLHSLDARFGSNKRPSNEDLSLGTIDASKLSTTDPRWKLISNANPDADSNTATGNVGSIDVMHNANGPDGVNPNDPVLGGGSEPIDPNKIK